VNCRGRDGCSSTAPQEDIDDSFTTNINLVIEAIATHSTTPTTRTPG